MKQYITLELDRPRRLRFGTNALCMVEDMTGKKLTNGNAFSEFGLKDIRTLVYCGLYHDDKTLTTEQVGDLIDDFEGGLHGCFEKVGEAIQLAFPQADETSGTDGKK